MIHVHVLYCLVLCPFLRNNLNELCGCINAWEFCMLTSPAILLQLVMLTTRCHLSMVPRLTTQMITIPQMTLLLLSPSLNISTHHLPPYHLLKVAKVNKQSLFCHIDKFRLIFNSNQYELILLSEN